MKTRVKTSPNNFDADLRECFKTGKFFVELSFETDAQKTSVLLSNEEATSLGQKLIAIAEKNQNIKF